MSSERIEPLFSPDAESDAVMYREVLFAHRIARLRLSMERLLALDLDSPQFRAHVANVATCATHVLDELNHA